MTNFYAAVDITTKKKALEDILADEGFICRQADLIFRYIDGVWLKLDFDKIVLGFDISKSKAKEITFMFGENFRLDKIWNISILKGNKKGTVHKYYKNSFIAKAENKDKIHISVGAKNISSKYRNIRIEFTPSYFSNKMIKKFFKSLFRVFGDEREKAIKNSIITRMDIGIQLHNIFSSLVTIVPQGKSTFFSWEYGGQKMSLAQGLYDEMKGNGFKILNVIYCPVSNYLHKLYKKNRYSIDEAKSCLSSIVPATRIESRYHYEKSTTAISYSVNKMRDVPFGLPDINIITPETFRQLSLKERLILATTKDFNSQGLPNIEPITLPKEKLVAEYNRLVNGFMTILEL
ncbi:hypothetical protein [Alteromonas naphthalenivorans]|nr:hypothetical protein [Alteromonas naphthalenivorans]